MKLRSKKADNNSAVTDKAAKKIAGALLLAQSRFSTFMDRIANKLDSRKKRLYLAVFSILFGSINIYIMIQAFSNQNPSPAYLKPTSISVPIHDSTHADIRPQILSDSNLNQRK
jgi:hypothetical protein